VAALKVDFCDEFDGGFGWIVDEFMERCSHALDDDGRVWVVDPVDGDGVEERIRAAGTPAGVLQLLDRHNRDCAALAARLGVRHHVVPGVARPFAPIAVKNRAPGRRSRSGGPTTACSSVPTCSALRRTSAPATSGWGCILSCGCVRRVVS
jgi:hypothetical protein